MKIHKKILIISVFTFGLFAFTSVYAGEMEIENGTVFNDSFTKDGRTVEISKTYTFDGVTIHQKIWDENGELIRDRVTEKELSPNVTIVSEGSSSSSESVNAPVSKTNEIQEKEVDETNIEEKTEEEFLEIEKEVEERIENTEKETDELLERIRKRERLNSVDRVYFESDIENQDKRVRLTVEGTKKQRLFGLINVSTPSKSTYDAETGMLLEKHQNILQRVLEAFSF